MLFTYHLQALLEATGSPVTANVADPGVVDTDLYRHVFWGTRLIKKLFGWYLFKVRLRWSGVSLWLVCSEPTWAEFGFPKGLGFLYSWPGGGGGGAVLRTMRILVAWEPVVPLPREEAPRQNPPLCIHAAFFCSCCCWKGEKSISVRGRRRACICSQGPWSLASVSDSGLMGLRGSHLERAGGIWGCPSGLSLALVCALLKGVGSTPVCLEMWKPCVFPSSLPPVRE